MSFLKLTFLPLSLCLLSSCLVGPNYKGAPNAGLPATWVNEMPPQSGETDLTRWWQGFRDPQLTQLINTGFAASPDMINAALAIKSSEYALRSTRSSLFPTAGANLGGSNAGDYTSTTAHGSWNGGLSASWTPDIWGGTRREVQAAYASLGSSKAAANATRTALASSIATAYFQWITATENLRIAQQQLGYQERTYRIVKERFEAGMQPELDLQQALATIVSTRASIPQYEANIKSYENSLALLLGTTADQVHLRLPSPSIYNYTPRVPMGLPSELLRRRPDSVQAECNLQRATANVGVATARLFPSISLTGGTSGRAGTDFAGFWGSTSWSLAASASQTIFNRVALRDNVNMAHITKLTAAQTYRKTVLSAFAEVEENLITYARLVKQLPQYEAAAAANKRAAKLSLDLYSSGNGDFLNVASAERAWLSAELNLITTRQQIRMALARLSTSLGGGY